jgi:hypothetical protein
MVHSQNNFEVGISTSLIKFSDKSATIIGDRYLFQVPKLNLAYQFNKKFSVVAGFAFSAIDHIGFISNSIDYNSFGGSIRYH